MPYHVVHDKELDKWFVETDETGERRPKDGYPTEAEAVEYLQALEANVPDAHSGKHAARDDEYKVGPGITLNINDRTVTGLAAVTGNLDDGNDRIWPGAFTQTVNENRGRIRHLWNHDDSQPPTAVIRDLHEIGREHLPPDLLTQYPEAKGGLLVAREYLNTPRADEILAGIRASAIKEMSIRYLPIRKDYEHHEGKSARNLREVRLLETSDVLWGMNPATRAVKGAIPFKESPLAAKDSAWDGASELDRATVAELKLMCAWGDPDGGDSKADYQLPHHRADDGHTVVWRGVARAMTALLKADIPADARRAVYDHLSQHFAQFNEVPPDYKFYELGWTVQAVQQAFTGSEAKAGRMISAANMGKLKAALEALQEIMAAAEPPSPEAMMEKAFTVKSLMLQLEQAELDFMRQGGKDHAKDL